MRSMLKPFHSIWDGTLRKMNTVKLHIDLIPNARPVMSRPYRAGPAARKETDQEIQRMKDQDFIESAQ